MRDQAITSLSAALRHIRVLIDTAPQPEESLEVIYEWVGDWDQTWAGIYSWWKYVDKNEISIPKVCNANLRDMTEETTMQQNKVIPAVIAIADLHQPEGQRRFHIDDVFEDYQEWVEERARLEAERLAKALSVHTQGQTARDVGQDHVPKDTEGHLSRGAARSTGGGSGSASKGKGKQKAISEEDELADDINDDEGDGKGKGEPGPSAKGPHVAGDNEPCETCVQANRMCIGEPESSCKWCQKAKHKCSHSRGVGRKRKNSGTIGEAGPSHKPVKSFMTLKPALAESATKLAKKLTLKIPAQKWQPDLTPTRSPSPQPTPSPHDPLPTPCLFFHRATPTPRPSFKPSPAPVDEPGASLPINKPQVMSEPFFVTATGLLEEPGDIEVSAQSNTPPATEILEVEYPCKQLTANIVERLQVLEARAKDEEFELEQVYWLLETRPRNIRAIWHENSPSNQGAFPSLRNTMDRRNNGIVLLDLVGIVGTASEEDGAEFWGNSADKSG
ncbi:hypothetical protein M404DRAFT_33412 [Pisolithus tinctorius Marx 270]|uniref:Uncharacterized protein n=1 Tax=Pisolithus tinctorius Marx 270 TaxID=870435 RepID=A0A0C3N5L6_PISTI|nr:hypothetical protein M404DRAFT_33412 [Pisolithus tinctorius Marx 270]